jgi:hypothetical protein
MFARLTPVFGAARVALLIASGSLLLPSSVEATSEEPVAKVYSAAECVQAHSSAQELQQSGELLESRAQLLVCAQESCPQIVRMDCVNFLEELRGKVPSIVFRVTVDGEVRSQISAELDDKPLFSVMPNRALPLNPGKHRLRLRYAELAPIERELTITEGEQLVPVVVSFQTAREAHQTREKDKLSGKLETRREPPKQPTFAPTIRARRPVPWSVFALGGLGVAGFGSYLVFGAAARSKENNLRDSCSPACSEAEIDSVRNRARLANGSLAVGGVAMVAAGTFYFLRPKESLRIGATFLPSGGIKTQLSFGF